MIEGKQVPNVIFKTRVKDNSGEFEWRDLNSDKIFKDKRVVVFALPGAFTPTCSSTHLPGYEEFYNQIKSQGIDEVYCLSVNDAFVMNQWGIHQGGKSVKLLPDGNAEFTRKMGMLVRKENLGFGDRSWRYSMYVEDGTIKQMFVEKGYSDNCQDDPFEVSDADTMLKYLQENKA